MAISTSSQPLIPIFNGEKYEFWSIKMKTLFKSQDLWDLVVNGVQIGEDEGRNNDNKKKDSKALFFIQQAMDDSVFSRISMAETSKEAWDILEKEFQGSLRVKTVKLQSMRCDFETMNMNEGEGVQTYLSRVSTIVNKMRSFGEQISDEKVVSKVLRSLPTSFEHVVAAIEESKDLAMYSFDEMMSSLMSHEERINRRELKTVEKAFQVKETSTSGNKEGGRGRGAGSAYRGRGGRGAFRGRGSYGDKRSSGGQKQCYYCKKFGHIETNCWNKQRNQKGKDKVQCEFCKKFGHSEDRCWSKQKQANVAEKTTDQNNLFMTHFQGDCSNSEIWFLDSGCSNHMTGMKTLFKEIDMSKKSEVKFGDNNAVQVEGKGSIAVGTNDGKVKLLHDVLYVPKLAHTLLSIGQLIDCGYKVEFDEKACKIEDKKGKATNCKNSDGSK
ncbi:hypothetical protein KFK09_024542 [Dendrobium nobile]|uniref:CCHC-type domain-containing protein n=1 Tax=Dendrobium nobile TaxID=94219 RepID=A0A8T3AE42_DENNO|nr:hypothetical protein KFK09_024542 [Dendrobium nobile]